MKSKVFIPSEERFYIIDGIEKCDRCGKSELKYDGCSCHTEDAFRDTLRDAVQTQHDILISTLEHSNNNDIYFQGLVRGGITSYLKVLQLLEEK
jgi:hypothetical protein